MKISAVIVTRGNVELGPCLEKIEADEVIIKRGKDGIWERWEGAAEAVHDVVYTQDDDAIVDYQAVIAAYKSGLVTCNMPAAHRPKYPDGIALVGFGCIFDKSALAAFARYRQYFPIDDNVFRRHADRVFTGLNRLKLIDVPVENRSFASDPDRMWRQSDHWTMTEEIRKRIRMVRGVGAFGG